MTNLLDRLVREESGQGMVEYGLILGLIAVVVVAVLTTLGTDIKAQFQKIADQLPS